MAHIDPRTSDTSSELEELFESIAAMRGYVPNSLLTMQRKPAIVRGFASLSRAVMQESSEVDSGFKSLVAHVASRAAGCQYCQAHSLVAAEDSDVSEDQLADLWEYAQSEQFNRRETVALDFALAAASVPNEVDSELMDDLKAHWSDDEIIELLGVVSLFGFLNRWNDSLATDLEPVPLDTGQLYFADEGWDGGKHRPDRPGQ